MADGDAKSAADTAAAKPAADATADAISEPEGDFESAFEEFASQDDTLAEGETLVPDTPEPEPDPEPEDAAASAAPQLSGDLARTPEDDPAAGEPAATPATPAADPAAADTPDIWADASPDQKAAHEAALQENRSHRGRASSEARRAAARAATIPAAAEPAAEPETEATDEEWEEFQSEYPEVAGPMKARFEGRLERQDKEIAELQGQMKGISDGAVADLIDAEEETLAASHPDWEAMTATPEFNTWLNGAPRFVQEGMARNGGAIVDGAEASQLLDIYVADTAPAPGADDPAPEPNNGRPSRRERRLKAAVTEDAGNAGPGSGPPEGDFDAAFDAFAAKDDAAAAAARP